MSTHQPFLTTVQGPRRFACSAVAVWHDRHRPPSNPLSTWNTDLRCEV